MNKKLLVFIFLGMFLVGGIIFYNFGGEDRVSKILVGDTAEEIESKALLKKVKDRNLIMNLREKDSLNMEKEGTTNLKDYDSSKKTIKIKDSKGDSIMELKLDSSYEVTGLIASSNTKVAELTLVDTIEDNSLFENIKFYDKNNNYEEVDKIIRFNYGVEKEYCNDLGCKSYFEWIEFEDIKDLPRKKDIKIGLFTETFPNEHIEWVAKIEGFEILEWAAWNVSTAVYLDVNLSVNVTTNKRGLYLKPDGTKLYVMLTNGVVNQRNLSIPWNVSSAGSVESVGPVITGNIQGFFMSSDGTKFYVAQSAGSGRRIDQWTMSTPWNVSTASDDSISQAVLGDPLALTFSTDGCEMYTADPDGDIAYQFTLDTCWDLSTASPNGSLDISGDTTVVSGLFFKNDGTKLYVLDRNPKIIYQYPVSSAWNLSIAGSKEGSFDMSLQMTGEAYAPFFKADGTRFWAIDEGTNKIFEYDLLIDFPTYSGQQTNTTAVGEIVTFAILYDDNIALDPNGEYIFSTNNTGLWVNESAVNWTSTPEWANVSKILNNTIGLVIGYRWYANDTAGNVNNSDIFELVTDTDTTPPTWTTIPANASLNYAVEWAGVTFTATDFNFDNYYVNDTLFTINSTGYLLNASDMAVGNYLINVSVNDTSNNMNYTLYLVQISQSTPGGSIAGTSSITYPTTGDVQGTESNPGDGGVVYSLYRNGTSVSNPDATILAANFYNYIYNSTAGANYTANASIDTFNLTINQNSTSCQVYFNESSPLAYPNIFLAITNCSSAYTLTVNDSAISNNSVQDSGVGAYNYTVQRTDGENYTNIYDEEEFQVSAIGTSGSLAGTSPINWGIAGDVTGTESNLGDGGVVYSLYRDGVLVSNPDATILAAGGYNYIYNSTAGANYSVNPSIDTFVLTVDPNLTSCQVYFNETSPFTWLDPFTVWTNCSSAYVLYRNGTIIANDSSQVLGVGAYNFTVQRDDGINYSNIYDEEQFLINPGVTSGTITGTSPISYGTIGDVVGTESNPLDGGVVYSLYRDGVLVSNPDLSTLAAGGYNYIYNSTAGANYSVNPSIDTFALTINQATPTGSISGSTPLVNGTAASITGSETNTGDNDLTYLLYRDGVSVVNPDLSTFVVGTYNYIYNTTGGTNYTSSASLATFILVITVPPGYVDYDDLTVDIIQVLQMLIIFSMVFVVMMSVRRVYIGDLTFGELFVLLVVSSLIFIVLLFLSPIAVSFIADLIQ